MGASAGKRQRIQLHRRGAPDDWGGPGDWDHVADFYGEVKGETGLGAIRTSNASGLPLATARYSIKMERKVYNHYTITADDRLWPWGHYSPPMAIKGVVQDFTDLRYIFVLCEEGTSES